MRVSTTRRARGGLWHDAVCQRQRVRGAVEGNDEREGRGTHRFASGDVYEGELKADKAEGRGTYRVRANGGVYEGGGGGTREVRVYRGARHACEDANGDVRGRVRTTMARAFTRGAEVPARGAARIVLPRRRVRGRVQGIRERGAARIVLPAAAFTEGRGTYRDADGDVYEGEFVMPEKEGRGTMRYANGNVYEGEWKGGDKEGRGTYRLADGGTVESERHVVQGGQGRGRGRGEYAADKQARHVWSADGETAWRLREGDPMEEISLEEARRVASEHGLPLPSGLYLV